MTAAVNPSVLASHDDYLRPGITGAAKRYTLLHPRKAVALTRNAKQWMNENPAYVHDVIAEHGLSGISQIVHEMRLNNNGALLDEVGDNAIALLYVIVIVALVPAIGAMVATSMGDNLPAEWQGGLDAAGLWTTNSVILGAVVSIALVSLIIGAILVFKKK